METTKNFDLTEGPGDHDRLMKQLNMLLLRLGIPIPLISPTDLTPGLLIAILESLLDRRIPIIHEADSNLARVQGTKIFLGVLETDILQTDVGLSDVDPQRLAEGEWEEVLFIADLLCWVGRRIGLLPARLRSPSAANPATSTPIATKYATEYPKEEKSQLDLDAEVLFQDSKPRGQISETDLLSLSPFIPAASSPVPNEDPILNGFDDSKSDTLSALALFEEAPVSRAPQCIHEVPSPSLLLSIDGGDTSNMPKSSFRHLSSSVLEHSTSHTPPPVRYSGFIEPVDEDTEIASFEQSHSISSSSFFNDRSRKMTEFERSLKVEALNDEYARTLELLNQRAALQAQLARLKNLEPS